MDHWVIGRCSGNGDHVRPEKPQKHIVAMAHHPCKLACPLCGGRCIREEAGLAEDTTGGVAIIGTLPPDAVLNQPKTGQDENSHCSG